MRIERIDTTPRLQSLRGAWQELLADSATSNPFLTWEWLEAWWRRFGTDRRLAVLAGWSGGRLDLLAPFTERRRDLARGMLCGRLEIMGTGNVGSDYLDVILRRRTETAGLARLGSYLYSAPSPVALPRVHAEASQMRGLGDRLADGGWHVSLRRSAVCPYITLASHTWESFLTNLGREHRANVRRRLRKIAERFEVRFERADSDERREQFLSTLVRLHQMRWHRRGGSTAFNSAALIAFHHDFTRRALEQGWLRLFVLYLDGCPAAALYGLRYGDTFYFYQSGFDPRYSSHGVGLVIMALAIRHAIDDGAAEYDFLHGDEPYKFLWTDRSHDLAELELYPPTTGGLAAMRLVELTRRTRHAIRRVASRAGLFTNWSGVA